MNNWIDRAVIYQVLIDRFATNIEFKSLNSNTFMGGNIIGITNKLNYIKELGCNAIWISPFCTSLNYHGFHIVDYENVDPHFGSKNDLVELIKSAHKAGLRVIVDYVPNHCSNQHPFFLDAIQNKDSQYRDWFYIDKKNRYKYFMQYDYLPKLNLDNPDAKNYLINIALEWCNLGVDAFRIDHAIGPSFQFWKSFTNQLKQFHPDVICFGEIWSHGLTKQFYPSVSLKNKFKKYFFGVTQEELQQDYINVFDGLLDFSYRDLLLNEIKKGNRIENNPSLLRKVQHHFSRYPSDFKLILFLDNHDTNRFLHECCNDESLLLEAIRFTRRLNKPFVVYYGTEQKMCNDKDIFDGSFCADLRVRQCMDWNNRDLKFEAKIKMELTTKNNTLP